MLPSRRHNTPFARLSEFRADCPNSKRSLKRAETRKPAPSSYRTGKHGLAQSLQSSIRGKNTRPPFCLFDGLKKQMPLSDQMSWFPVQRVYLPTVLQSYSQPPYGCLKKNRPLVEVGNFKLKIFYPCN